MSDMLDNLCNRKPTHWKCIGTDRRCMISFVECKSPVTTTTTSKPMSTAKINDVFRDDTVVSGVTDLPKTLSTTPYLKVEKK